MATGQLVGRLVELREGHIFSSKPLLSADRFFSVHVDCMIHRAFVGFPTVSHGLRRFPASVSGHY